MQSRFDALIANGTDLILVVDSDLGLSYASPSACRFLGGPLTSLGDLSLLTWVHAADKATLCQAVQAGLAGESTPQRIEFRLQHCQNTWHTVEAVVQSFREEQGPVVVINAHDIGDRRLAENALRESRERYELVAAATNDGLWDWSVARNEVYYSSRWKQMMGLAEDEIGDGIEEWFALVHPDESDSVRTELDQHLAGTTLRFESEYRILHADGTYRYMSSNAVAVRDESGVAIRVVGAQWDITEQKVTQEQLQHDAFHDKLTGLPNRALFMERLERAITRARRRADTQFAVLFLDLDRFKVINDSLGHTIGDKLLVEVTRRMRRIVRSNDTFSRLGGDEFTILMDDIDDISDATRLAERIQEELAEPFALEGHEVVPAVSIGIALSRSGYLRAEEILRDADIAMYRAKGSGRGRHEVFDREMHERVVGQLRLEGDIRRALERDELELHYQPIVSLRSGELAGFEALARWTHPERGKIPPGDFIPVAEETGLIVPLGEWVLRAACRQTEEWNRQRAGNDEGRLIIAVNISSKQFSQTGLVDKVRTILEDSGLHAFDLKLEITESVIMENALSAAEMLRQLETLQVQLSIDDFGTGYSSLSSLHQFPLHTLKIDRSFVDRLGSGGSSTIVKTIVSMANNLGMNVVAEGIESQTQLEQIIALGCDYGQGFYFSQPMPAVAVDEFLANGQARWALPAPV